MGPLVHEALEKAAKELADAANLPLEYTRKVVVTAIECFQLAERTERSR